MKVLLIIPTSMYKYGYPRFLSSQDFPVGFAYLASALKTAGHKVFGINPNNDVYYDSAYEMISAYVGRSISELQPDIIGIGGLCTDYKFLKDLIGIIRSLASDIPIVCGGGIINNDAEFIFPVLKPDFCLIGESEEALVSLVNCIASGNTDYEKVYNLGYWKDGKPCFTQRNFNYIDIDQLAFPDYEPFNIRDMIDNYALSTRILHRYPRDNPRPMTIVTARSCPFECTFCVHNRREIKYRARSVKNIISEIASLYEQYQFNILVIHDELFAINKSRLKEFCDHLGDARSSNGWDFNWMFQTHSSAALDRETLKIAKNLGCYYFSYGLESASPTVLTSMNKKSKPAQIVSAIEAASDVGIGFGGNYIFGDIAETRKTISETLNFMKIHCEDIHIHLGVIHPFPGSRIFENCIERKIIPDKLNFYETIDENDFNMTSILDWIWTRWVPSLYRQAESYSWVKSVDAIRVVKDGNYEENVYLAQTGQTLFKVLAKCPHCGKESDYFEPLKFTRVDPSSGVSSFLKIKSAWLKERANRSIVLSIMAFAVYIIRVVQRKISNTLLTSITRRMLIFKLTEDLDINGIHSEISFITGCRHCNKRYRINIMPDLLH